MLNVKAEGIVAENPSGSGVENSSAASNAQEQLQIAIMSACVV